MASSACLPTSGARALIADAEAKLSAAGVPGARFDAELLLAHVLELTRPQLVAMLGEQTITTVQLEQFQALVTRRAAREPLAYVTGSKGFRKIELSVDARVLVPRPETELLVATAIVDRPCGVLDVGTGSGAVALALAFELPDGTVDAVDISADALEVATANAQRLGLAGRTRFFQSDLLASVDGVYDTITANLPYVPSHEIDLLQPEITKHEPRLALDGGRDGLDLVRRLVQQAPAHLKPGGMLALEIGDGQGRATALLLLESGFDEVDVHLDLAEKERVVSGRRGKR